MTPKKFKEYFDEILKYMHGDEFKLMREANKNAGDEGAEADQSLDELTEIITEFSKQIEARNTDYFNSDEFVASIRAFNKNKNNIERLTKQNPNVLDDGKKYQFHFQRPCEHFTDKLEEFGSYLFQTREDLEAGTGEWPVAKEVDCNLKGKFTDIAKKLDKAKTWYNSGLYNDLADMVEDLDKETKIDKDEKLTNVQKYAAKLWQIKTQIDKYLDHKAKDGVKDNVQAKLSAVEELNEMVSERLKDLTVPAFMYGKNKVDVKALKLTYEDDVAEHAARKGKDAPELSDKYVAINKAQAKLKTKEDGIAFWHADTCMCRIIARAGEREQEITDLRENLKQAFGFEPAKKVAAKFSDLVEEEKTANGDVSKEKVTKASKTHSSPEKTK